MFACVDVDYRDAGAVAACVCFQAWSDSSSALEAVVRIGQVEPYESGQFYRRELPCLLTVLKSLPELPEVVVIDGFVWLGRQQPGLGAHLYEALGGQVAVVGVAKSRFLRAAPVEAILRGKSRSPLYISAAGRLGRSQCGAAAPGRNRPGIAADWLTTDADTDLAEVAGHIRAMHGPYRIPTLLKRVDQLCRGLADIREEEKRDPRKPAVAIESTRPAPGRSSPAGIPPS
jgi:deoxyribonuclease V